MKVFAFFEQERSGCFAFLLFPVPFFYFHQPRQRLFLPVGLVVPFQAWVPLPGALYSPTHRFHLVAFSRSIQKQWKIAATRPQFSTTELYWIFCPARLQYDSTHQPKAEAESFPACCGTGDQVVVSLLCFLEIQSRSRSIFCR